MLQKDYLMRMIVALAVAIREALGLRRESGNNALAIHALDDAIGEAADIDPDVLLSLDPQSISTILLLGSLNDSAAEYIVHALMIEADCYEEDGFADKALLRRKQAQSIAAAYECPYRMDRLEEMLNPTGAQTEEERDELEAEYLDEL